MISKKQNGQGTKLTRAEKNRERYIRRFAEIESGITNGKIASWKMSWNWPAFVLGALTGIGWTSYRKMHGMTIAVELLYCAMSAAVAHIPVGNFTEHILETMLLGSLMGAFGNYAYYYSIRRKIRQGYHLIDRYRPTSIGLPVTLFLVAFAVHSTIVFYAIWARTSEAASLDAKAAIAEEIVSSNVAIVGQLAALGMIVAILLVATLRERSAARAAVAKVGGIFNDKMSEENLRKVV